MIPRWFPVLAAVLLLACGSGPSEPAEATAAVVQATADDWCAEHALPESMCTQCNPELAAGFQASGDWCAEHAYPESACPLCNPVPPPEGVADHHADEAAFAPGTVIRFREPALEETVGLTAAPATNADPTDGVRATARVAFDQDRLADVRAVVPGVVRTLHVGLGDRVEAGAPLFTVESAAIGDLRARLRTGEEALEVARARLQRQQALREQGVASSRQLETARQEVEAAEAEVDTLQAALRTSGARAAGASGRYTVVAPLAGTVIRRPAVVGAYAEVSDSLATVADTSRMWVLLEVPDAHASRLAPGQPVTVQVDGLPGTTFRGELDWVAAEIDPRSRTLTARAVLDNPEGRLKAHQFGRATVRVRPGEEHVTVPEAALQRLGERAVVFVRREAGVYEPREVVPGRSGPEGVQVHGALAPGEQVVSEGAFLLKTELSRDDIGAGCCEVEPPGGG